MRMKKIALLRAVVAAVALLSLAPLAAETKLSVSVTPGKNWETTTWLGVFPMRHAPQIAVWIEDASGNFVETLEVSGKSASNKWLGSPENGRPEALPVWRHKAQPAANEVDAASSATPKKGVELDRSGIDLASGAEYTAYLEVNTSFDYNDAWPKNARKGAANYSGVNGQPSVVYSARFVAGQDVSVNFAPVGTGSVDGSDGSIRPGFDGLTTAMTMVERATLSVK